MQCLKNRTQKPLTRLPSELDHFLSAPSTWETKQLLALVTLAFDLLLYCSFTETEHKIFQTNYTVLRLDKNNTQPLETYRVWELGETHQLPL